MANGTFVATIVDYFGIVSFLKSLEYKYPKCDEGLISLFLHVGHEYLRIFPFFISFMSMYHAKTTLVSIRYWDAIYTIDPHNNSDIQRFSQNCDTHQVTIVNSCYRFDICWVCSSLPWLILCIYITKITYILANIGCKMWTHQTIQELLPSIPWRLVCHLLANFGMWIWINHKPTNHLVSSWMTLISKDMCIVSMSTDANNLWSLPRGLEFDANW